MSASPTLAWNFCTRLMPSTEYVYEPSIEYRLFAVPAEELAKRCPPLPPGMDINARGGCVLRPTQLRHSTQVWVRSDVTDAERACITTHELAHLNGWRHGDRFEGEPDLWVENTEPYTP